MPSELNAAAIAEARTLMQEIVTGATEHLTEAQQTEARAIFNDGIEALRAANEGRLDGEAHRRLDNLVDSMQEFQRENERLRVAAANARFQDSNDVARLRIPNAPDVADLDIKTAAHRLLAVQHSRGDANSRHAAALRAALTESAFEAETIDRHFIALEKRLRDAGRVESMGLIRHMREEALGISEHPIDRESVANVRAITTAADSGRDAIPVMVQAQFWADVILTEEALMGRLPAIPMTSPELHIPMIGESVWNDTVVVAETGNLPDGDARIFQSEMSARYALDGVEFISQNMLEDSLPMIDAEIERLMPQVMAEGIDRAIISADTNTTAASNVNGEQYAEPVSGTARRAEFIGWNGIRSMVDKVSELKHDAAGTLGTTNALDLLTTLRNLLGRASIRPGSFLYIAPTDERIAIRDNVREYRQVDAVGMQVATLLAGDLTQVMSGSIISPEGMPTGAQDSGLTSATPGDNTLGFVLCAVPNLLRLGIRVAPYLYTRQPAGPQAHGVWIGARARVGFAARGYNSTTGAQIAGASRPRRAPFGLLRNISRS